MYPAPFYCLSLRDHDLSNSLYPETCPSNHRNHVRPREVVAFEKQGFPGNLS